MSACCDTAIFENIETMRPKEKSVLGVVIQRARLQKHRDNRQRIGHNRERIKTRESNRQSQLCEGSRYNMSTVLVQVECKQETKKCKLMQSNDSCFSLNKGIKF